MEALTHTNYKHGVIDIFLDTTDEFMLLLFSLLTLGILPLVATKRYDTRYSLIHRFTTLIFPDRPNMKIHKYRL
jgi:non-ribosomal peptide synthetase component E (peptide arylation enzyme)